MRIYKIRIIILFIFFSVLFSACSGDHLITNSEKRTEVNNKFNDKAKMFDRENAWLDSESNTSLTQPEREALEFLYAYAPLTDLTFGSQNYLNAVRATLDARVKLPWGRTITEDMFLHFVLPLRVNNENLDSSRVVFYNLLKDRVKGMSIKDAALEVNHWCHENVVYTPSDARTSSPLASVKTAYGRCGEESVLTVAALRAVGIPARQVYTPRWAHSDDNHAWVEVWGGDKWYYMGACEPEPRLDMGWFTAPAMRGMLMHTKVYGDYDGVEEVMQRNPLYTEINVTQNYTDVKKVDINVVDQEGKPVENADVEIKIFNYAEFYTAASKTTDKDGKTSISLGLGDVLVWASKDGMYGFKRLSVPNEDAVTLVISDKTSRDAVSLEIVPPVEKQPVIVVGEEEKAANMVRLMAEDSIRGRYVATFMSVDAARALASNLSLDADKVADYIVGSRGNYSEIVKFFNESAKIENVNALDMLRVISEKDLRDVKAEYLISHAKNAVKYIDKYPKDIFDSYVLNPRIANEMIDGYVDMIQAFYTEELTVKQIIEIARGVRIKNEYNSAVAPVKPSTVLTLNMSDDASRNIFFVAVARTYGIASRLSPITGEVQYLDGENWIDVNFEESSAAQVKQGTMTVKYVPINNVPDPKYGTHFTLARALEDGKYQLINMPGNLKYDMGEGESASAAFRTPRPVDVGEYMLTTGTRMANGAVLANISFFNIEEGKNSAVDLVLRENSQDVFVVGNMNPEARVKPVGSSEIKSILDITGRGYFILALVQSRREMTSHAMRNLSKIKESIEKWGRPVVIAFNSEEDYAKFNPEDFGELPKINYVIDSEGEVSQMFRDLKYNPDIDLPIFIVSDTFGRVVYKTNGYQINLGDNIQNVLNKL